MGLLGHIDAFIDEVDRSRNIEEINFAVRRHVEFLGFELFSYQLIWPPSGPRFPLYITNYPYEWTKRYVEKQHIRHDLVSRTAAAETRPFLWSSIPNLHKMTSRQKLVFDEATEFKLKYGGVIPLNGPNLAKAVFVVANTHADEDGFEKLFLSRRHEVQLMASYAHERMLDIGLQAPPQPSVKLSPREIEVMTYTAAGKTTWDISKVLGLSENTVKEHIANVCNKLGVYNKVHATSIALIHGLIAT